jgi:hypothetical protein
MGLYGPAVTQESLVAASATGLAASPNGYQWTRLSRLEAHEHRSNPPSIWWPGER